MDLGQVFTNKTVAEYMVSMFELGKDALILDPCFGAGAFLTAGMLQGFTNIEGYEIDEELYEKVKKQFSQFKLYNKDFLKVSNTRKYDGIIMNPPYIRQEKIDDLEKLGITKNKLRKNKIYALHNMVSEDKHHEGEVATDLELASLAAVLAKMSNGALANGKKICDPAAGSGNLICSSINIFNAEPNQLIANDINPKLIELLSLRLGLSFPKVIAKPNVAQITTEDIVNLNKSDFKDVDVVLLNPPFVAGIMGDYPDRQRSAAHGNSDSDNLFYKKNGTGT